MSCSKSTSVELILHAFLWPCVLACVLGQETQIFCNKIKPELFSVANEVPEQSSSRWGPCQECVKATGANESIERGPWFLREFACSFYFLIQLLYFALFSKVKI